MWAVIKFDKKNFHLLKEDFQKKINKTFQILIKQKLIKSLNIIENDQLDINYHYQDFENDLLDLEKHLKNILV